MKLTDNIFVDTSGFKALVDPKDEFNARAVKMWKELVSTKVGLVTSNYVLDESYTLIRAKCGVKVVKDFREVLARNVKDIKVMRVTLTDEMDAWKWFEHDWSKLSFTDCVSFALMRRLKLIRFFGFDEHFVRAGFLSCYKGLGF